MISLLIATLFSAGFGLVVRDAQGRDRNLWAVGAINYVFAALFHLVRAVAAGSPAPTAPTWAIGVLGGIAYVGSYAVLVPTMQLRGVSITTAILRLSVIIPILVSMLVWGERPDTVQTVGGVMAIVALPLLAYRPSDANEGSMSKRDRWVAVIVFVGNGLCMLAIRGFRQVDLPGQESWFLAILFGTAAIVACLGWWRNRSGSRLLDVGHGVLLGICNAVGNLALVQALQHYDSVLVFPFQAAVGMVFTAIFARIAWRERITRTESVGMVTALIAVILINVA